MEIYLAIDGDNIGRLVGQSALNNDSEAIKIISDAINSSLDDIRHLAEIYGGEIVSMGGDEAIIKFNSEDLKDDKTPASSLEEVEENLHQIVDEFAKHIHDEYKFTITAGIGSTVSEATKSLLAGKLNGKNQVVVYTPEVDDFIERVKSGEIQLDTKEQNIELDKLKEEYLNALKNKNEKQKEEAPSDEHKDLPEEYKNHIIIDEHPIMERKDEHFQNFLRQKEQEKLDTDETDENEGEVGTDDIREDKDTLTMDENENQKDNFEDNEKDLSGKDEDSEELQSEDAGAEFRNKKLIEGEPPLTPEQEAALKTRQETEQQDNEDELANMVEQESEQEMLSEEDQFLIEQIKEQLEIFKKNKDDLEALKDSNPELYEAILNMLQKLIDSVKAIKNLPQEPEEGAEAQGQELTDEELAQAQALAAQGDLGQAEQQGGLPPKQMGR